MKTAFVSSFQCKAIFFSEQERQQHTCLNAPIEALTVPRGGPPSTPLGFHHPSNLQTKTNGPLAFTNASPQNLIKPHHLYSKNPGTSLLNHHTQSASGVHVCDCSRSHTDSFGRGRAGSCCVCNSCGKIYENSGDSLSDFDLSVDSAGISGGHKCPNSPSVRGMVSDFEGMYYTANKQS